MPQVLIVMGSKSDAEICKKAQAILQKFEVTSSMHVASAHRTPERVKKLDELSSGFLYAVSSSSTTGSATNMTDVSGFLQRLGSYNLNNPVLVGFGIKDRESFRSASAYSNGAIIGTAYIRAIEGAEDVRAATKTFLSSVLG